MSKKKDRAWFVCPQWTELVSRHYASEIRGKSGAEGGSQGAV